METMRDRFVTITEELLDSDPRTALVLAEIGVDRFERTLRDHPDRVLSVGIREQLMISVAAGFALEGFRPIAHSYAPFVVERCFEQIKLDLGHQGVGAILASVGASYDWAAGGHTHHAPGDIALLSTLAGWQLHVPGHPEEVEVLLRDAAGQDERVYLRLSLAQNRHGRAVRSGALHIERYTPGAKATVVAVGPVLDRVTEAVTDLPVNLLYAATVRPFDAETLRAVAQTPQVVLVEPYLAGTSSGEVSQALADRAHRLLALGVGRQELRRYGSAEEHDAAHGLDVAGIRQSIRTFLDETPTDAHVALNEGVAA
ncbi:MAG: transketolase C-terminal domain-containing protein [Pseudomonadota bacterium]